MLIEYPAFDFIIKITCALSIKLQIWRATNCHSCQWNTGKTRWVFFSISRLFQRSHFILKLGIYILKDILDMMLWFLWRSFWVFNDNIGLCWGEIFFPSRLKNEKMMSINIFHEIFGVNCHREKLVVIFASSFMSQVKNTKLYSTLTISELSLNKIDHFSIRYFYLHKHAWTDRGQWNCLQKATGQVLVVWGFCPAKHLGAAFQRHSASLGINEFLYWLQRESVKLTISAFKNLTYL